MKCLATALFAFLSAASLFASNVAAAQTPLERHPAVSAHAARDAVERGAFVLDVRSATAFATGRIADAVRADLAATDSLQTLSERLSAAGIDTSRAVLLVGEAGDASAQALHQRLAQISSGKVLWLVGGMTEWQALGWPVQVGTATSKSAVPQRLVDLPGAGVSAQALGGKQLAAPQRRSSEISSHGLLYGFARLY